MHDHRALLIAAAHLAAERGPDFSMGEVARAAGVHRATIYRRYPNRTAVLDAVAELANEEACAGLIGADLEQLPIADAAYEAARVLIEVADRFYIAYDSASFKKRSGERSVNELLNRIFEGARARGEVDRDFSTAFVVDCFAALANAGCQHHVYRGVSIEDAAHAVGHALLHGVLPVTGASPLSLHEATGSRLRSSTSFRGSGRPRSKP